VAYHQDVTLVIVALMVPFVLYGVRDDLSLILQENERVCHVR